MTRSAPRPLTVLFVCEHGVFRSRVAAAFFDLHAPAQWRAASAGRDPGGTVETAARLLAGTPAATQLDTAAPRHVDAFVDADRVITIDCDLPGAIRWSLDHDDAEGVVAELRGRVQALVAELAR